MGCWVDGSISGMARELKRRCKGRRKVVIGKGRRKVIGKGRRKVIGKGRRKVIGKGRRKVIGKGMWHGNDAGRAQSLNSMVGF